MLNGQLRWNCGARDNESPRTSFPTNSLTRSRWTLSPLRSKAGGSFQSRESKAGKTSSFWTLPIAACHREKVNRCRGSRTFRSGDTGKLPDRWDPGDPVCPSEQAHFTAESRNVPSKGSRDVRTTLRQTGSSEQLDGTKELLLNAGAGVPWVTLRLVTLVRNRFWKRFPRG